MAALFSCVAVDNTDYSPRVSPLRIYSELILEWNHLRADLWKSQISKTCSKSRYYPTSSWKQVSSHGCGWILLHTFLSGPFFLDLVWQMQTNIDDCFKKYLAEIPFFLLGLIFPFWQFMFEVVRPCMYPRHNWLKKRGIVKHSERLVWFPTMIHLPIYARFLGIPFLPMHLGEIVGGYYWSTTQPATFSFHLPWN